MRHETNKGLIGTANDGIDAVTGDAIILLSADDALAPDALRRVRSAFLDHPSVGMVYGNHQTFEHDREVTGTTDRGAVAASQTHVHTGDRWLTARCRQGVNMVYSPEVTLRAAIQRSIGPYDPECRHTSDLNMWLRAGAVADVAFVDGPPLAYYRVHGSNMSAVVFGTLSSDLRERWVGFRQFFDWLGADDPRTERLTRLARRALAREALHNARRLIEREPEGPERESVVAELMERAAAIDPDGTQRRTEVRGGTRIPKRMVVDRLAFRARRAWWLRRWSRIGV
jgi:glycosyltransferase involved in cell wall biosynthesis